MKYETKQKIVRYLYQNAVGTTATGVGAANVSGAPQPQVGQQPLLNQVFNPDMNLAQFFNTLFKAAIVVGAMLAVLRLGYAGFVYMTTDLPGAKGGARTIISNAVIGLLLLLAVWLILRQINPQILNLQILQPFQQNPAGQGAGGLQGGGVKQGGVTPCFPNAGQVC